MESRSHRGKGCYYDNKKHANINLLCSGWKCSRCELTTNLWLNLTDGSILCGRRYFDGRNVTCSNLCIWLALSFLFTISPPPPPPLPPPPPPPPPGSGGNNHAVDHFESTRYPLAVKLGTITPDGADVFSYDEDDMVEDPLLADHLAHWGINITAMTKVCVYVCVCVCVCVWTCVCMNCVCVPNRQTKPWLSLRLTWIWESESGACYRSLTNSSNLLVDQVTLVCRTWGTGEQ